MKLFDWIEETARKAGRNKFLKSILYVPYHIVFFIVSKGRMLLRKHKFDKYGLEMLIEFDKCLKDHNIKYSLAFGSLLGAIREKGFIKHDDDADVWMWIDDYTPDMISFLKQYGFRLKYSFSLDNDKLAKEDTFEYKGVMIDIFYLYPTENGEAYSCIFNPFPDCATRQGSIQKYGGLLPTKCVLPISRNIVYKPFEDVVELPTPENSVEILKCRYGEDFMIPNPQWSKDRKDSHHVIWYGKVASYKEYI